MTGPTAETTNIIVQIALPEEHDIFLQTFPMVDDVSTDKLVRLTHDLGVVGYTLTSVLAEGMGSDLSGAATYSACEDLSPDLIICVGIAGTLADDLNLGDVAVANEIVDVLHASKVSDSTTGRGTRAELSPRNYPVDTTLQASCRFLRSHPALQKLASEWAGAAASRRDALLSRLAGKEVPGLNTDAAPSFQVGPIVCGPVLVSKALGKQLKGLNRKMLAIETESGGIFRTALDKKIPALTIRGISDRADPDKKKLESESKNLVRQLAMENAVEFAKVLTSNPAFMEVARRHSSLRKAGRADRANAVGPEEILRRMETEIAQTLEEASAEYKNRPNNAPLPLPRIQKLVFDEEIVGSDERPVTVIEAVREEKNLFIKISKSYPEKTIAWSIAQSFLRQDIAGKQILPIVLEGGAMSPPSAGVTRLSGVDLSSEEVMQNFAPVIIINEPEFPSRTKMGFLVSELKAVSHNASIIVVTKAETPIEAIDQVRSELGLSDYFTASVPFGEIAAYLEQAFEMAPGEADAAAARLEDTFSRFRLNTHPAYFIGIEESTLTALINANQRAELIELAVGGVLSFIVAADKSQVKLSRTTREEFLSELAYQIRVEKRSFCKSELAQFAESFADAKALELEPLSFLKGFFDIGLLTDCTGSVTFSLPFVEAFLLSEKLRADPAAAKRYFAPREEEFDSYAFDLYCERGAADEVLDEALSFASETLTECDDETNVFTTKTVRPLALSTPAILVDVGRKMGEAVEKIASEPSSERVRLEKQRLIDARDAVRQKVGDKRKQDRSSLSPERQQEFSRLDRLSRASSLLATLLGSGAERLRGETKLQAAELLMSTSERFLHYWTKNRMSIDFTALRKELLTDEAVDEIIEQFELFEDDREKIRASLSVFITDQELRALSGPLATILHRLAHLAGVRSLKPILERLHVQGDVQQVLRGAWFMDVEAEAGKRALKAALREYRGADLLRFVLANHLMWRVFWHHWQLTSRSIFVETAKSTLRPLRLLTGKEQERKILAGHRATPE